MSGWSEDDLERIGGAAEVELDGVTIWVVRVAGELYVRSYLGAAAHWYRRASERERAHISADGVERDVRVVADRAADEAVDAAYREKYGRNPYVDAMVADGARTTTLRLVP